MDTLKIISADDHLSETPDLWQSRLPKHLREKGPRFVTLPGGGDGWMMPGAQAPRPLGLDVMAGRKYDEYKVSGVPWSEVRPGCYEPWARLADMDEGGVWATVLYPNVGLGFGGGRGFSGDWEMATACLQAYNDHLAEFCSVNPKRLSGAAVLPMDTVENAVAEVNRVGKRPGSALRSCPFIRPTRRSGTIPITSRCGTRSTITACRSAFTSAKSVARKSRPGRWRIPAVWRR